MSDQTCHAKGDLCSACEQIVARFVNSEGNVQLVTDGPGARCPECGYPERHRVYGNASAPVADGCPSCEAPHPMGVTAGQPVGGRDD